MAVSKEETGQGDLLQPGEEIPHVTGRGLDHRTLRYGDVWQKRNLILVSLPQGHEAEAERYLEGLRREAGALDGHAAAVIVLRPGDSESLARRLPPPAVAVADRWGEVHSVVFAPAVAQLPSAHALLGWLDYLQRICPECQGETK